MFKSPTTYTFEKIVNDFIWNFIKTFDVENLNKIVGNGYNDNWTDEKRINLINIFEDAFAKFCKENNITTNYRQSIYNNYKLFRKYNTIHEFMFEIDHTSIESVTSGNECTVDNILFKKIILIAIDYKKDVFKIFITNKENKQMSDMCVKIQKYMKNNFNGKMIEYLTSFSGRVNINYEESYNIDKNILMFFPIVHNSYSPYYFNMFVIKQMRFSCQNFFNTKFYRNNKNKIGDVLKLGEICDV